MPCVSCPTPLTAAAVVNDTPHTNRPAAMDDSPFTAAVLPKKGPIDLLLFTFAAVACPSGNPLD
jgi:hypothetical protein